MSANEYQQQKQSQSALFSRKSSAQHTLHHSKQENNETGSFHESDILKLCAKKLQLQDIQHILPQAQIKNEESQIKQLKGEVMKLYYKIWNGYTKYIKRQIDKGRSIKCLIFGEFIQNKDKLLMQNEDSVGYQMNEKVQYSPNQEMINLLKLSNAATYFQPYSDQLLTQKSINVKLNIKIGYLRIQSGKISLQQILTEDKDHDSQSQTSCGSYYMAKRRMISQYSTNTSQRGTKNIFMPVKTPSTVSRQICVKYFHIKTNKYFQNKLLSQQSVDSQQNIIHMSNPNPQVGNPRFQRLDRSMVDSINKQSGIQIPGFKGIFQNGVHTRFGKRVIFDNNYNRGDLSEQLDQVTSKKNLLQSTFKSQRESEKQMIEDIKQQIYNEKRQKYELLLKTRKEIVQDNFSQIQQKNERKNQELRKSADHNYNIFPFNHGEQIEQRRIIYREEQKKDLLNFYQTQKSNKSQQQKSSSRQGNISTAQSTQLENTFNGKITNQYITQYPSYLKPQVLETRFQSENSRVKNALELALEKHEKELLDRQKMEQQYLQQIQEAAQNDFRQIENQRYNKKKLIEETKFLLSQQIEEQRKQQKEESIYRNERTRTNFGPEEDLDAILRLSQNNFKQKSTFKEDLLKQISEKKQRKERYAQLEQLQNEEMLKQSFDIALLDFDHYKLKNQHQKEQFREAWNQQIKLKEKEKAIRP